MTNYEKYFGSPERAAKSINDFTGFKRMKNGARNAYESWVYTNFDCLKDGMPLMLMWLQEECE